MEPLPKVLVRNILEHAQDHPWVMQELGLLALRLDDKRQHRLHVWDHRADIEDPVVHDHPFDLTSTVIVGELTNTRYEVTADGLEHTRVRYLAGDEAARRSDTVRLSASATTFREGDQYFQLSHELHDSRPTAGTVTIIHMAFQDVTELTVCRRDADAPWVSGRSRPATRAEIDEITAVALGRWTTEVTVPVAG